MPRESPLGSGIRQLFLLALLPGILGSCSGDGNEFRLSEAAPGAPLAFSDLPVLSVGVAEGDTLRELYRVVTPFRMPDGRLVIPESGDNAIRIFGLDGSYLETLGRPGEGPGEFSYLASAWPRGDTIEAFDGRLLRITRFLPGGAVESVSLETGAPSDRTVRGLVAGALTDGWISYALWNDGFTGPDSVRFYRHGADGSLVGEVADLEGLVRYRFSGGSAPIPLSPRAQHVLSDDRLVAGQTLRPRFHVFRPDGSRIREIAWEPEFEGTPTGVFGDVVAEAVGRVEEDRAAAVRERLEAAGPPARVPAYWTLRADGPGFVWVEPYDPVRHAVVPATPPASGSRSDTEWRIFSPEGTEVGWIRVPAGFEPWQITSEAVVGVYRDARGVEFVRVYGLERS